MEIRPATGRAALAEFIDFPYRKYAGDPMWVPPLRMSEKERFDPKKNPFLEHADVQPFLAVDGGRTTGRVAAIIDHAHEATHHDNIAAFGFFEANDEPTARALLSAVEGWARERRRGAVRGPLNPSLNDTAGLLVDGFDTPPMLLMPHNPPEYAGFITAAGYAKVKDLYAWLYELGSHDDRVKEIAARVRQRYGVVIRSIDTSRMDEEILSYLNIYAQAWKDNWGFVAPSAAESDHFVKELKQILDPRFVISAEIKGVRVACAVAVPDMNQVLKGTDGRLFPMGIIRFLFRKRLVDQGRLLLLGVLPEYRGFGLLPLLVHELAARAAGLAYKRVEFSWVLEDNSDINQPASQVATRYKTYRIYQKAIA
jgi:GNAT superfamily N-acetyltransferase